MNFILHRDLSKRIRIRLLYSRNSKTSQIRYDKNLFKVIVSDNIYKKPPKKYRDTFADRGYFRRQIRAWATEVGAARMRG